MATRAFASPPLSSSLPGSASPQVISWRAVEYASAYRLEILDMTGATVFDAKGPECERRLDLPAGGYRYRITAFNALGKPEAVGPWESLEILKALFPKVNRIDPVVLYVDGPVASLSIFGENLFDTTEVSLVRSDGRETVCSVSEAFPGGSGILVPLPSSKDLVGTYRVLVRNPGGQSSRSSSSFSLVSRPLLTLTPSAGWASLAPVFDDWYTSTWDETLYPKGLTVRADVAFARSKALRPGVRLEGSAFLTEAAVEGASVRSDMRAASVYFFAERPLSPMFSVAAGIGGGGTWSFFRADYGDGNDFSSASLDFCVSAFVEARYVVLDHLSFSIGAGASDVLYRSAQALSVRPAITVGWRF